jgi:tyrosyl-DNA phosphodiesterase 2
MPRYPQKDQPNTQHFYYFDPTADPPRWHPTSNLTTAHQASLAQGDRLHLISWNIDFQVPGPIERMSAALYHLEELLSGHDKINGPPTVIFFQEMVASDLELIQQTPWVQKRFYITDLSGSNWQDSYGTLTLVDRRLALQRVFRVPYALSRMQRDGLFIDINMHNSVIRLCNTHLESLASGNAVRPVQLKVASEFMHGTTRGSATRPGGEQTLLPIPHAAILAGDLNAFAPQDAITPTECGLQDAFSVLGGQDGTDDSFTWGKQNPGWMANKFPCGRLDKVLFCGGAEILRLTKFGEGLKTTVDTQTSDDDYVDLGSGRFAEVWVTDHFGLSADFRILPPGAE